MGPPEQPTDATFAQLAAAFLELVGDAGFSWRCAWTGENSISSWVDRYGSTLTRYGRTASVGSIPTIARIWGATRDGVAAAIVDQENLRTWVWSGGACVELTDTDPFDRIAEAVRLETG